MAPTIAICTHLPVSIKEASIAAGQVQQLAVDYSINPKNILTLADDIQDIRTLARGKDAEIRYHGVFPQAEIGHVDRKISKDGLAYLKNVVGSIDSVKGRYLTIHIGLDRSNNGLLSIDRAIESLSELVQYGRDHGVNVCLENLGSGLTSDPRKFITLIRETGARATFDIGHASSSKSSAGYPIHQSIKELKSHIANAHVYETEDLTGHVAFQTLNGIKPTLDALIDTDCDWWVIEVGEITDIKRMSGLVRTFINSHTS